MMNLIELYHLLERLVALSKTALCALRPHTGGDCDCGGEGII